MSHIKMWMSRKGRPHFLFAVPRGLSGEGGRKMTINEASERYNIPIEILREYEAWGLCGTVKKVMGAWQYDDQDLERLSMIMTLHDIGFSNGEVETYIRLLLEGDATERERMGMLDRLRSRALEDIHFRERQLERLDYLRHKIRTAQKNEKDRKIC